MRMEWVGRIAAMVGIVLGGIASAEYGQDADGTYVSPSKWSRFNVRQSEPAGVTVLPPRPPQATHSSRYAASLLGGGRVLAVTTGSSDGPRELLPAPSADYGRTEPTDLGAPYSVLGDEIGLRRGFPVVPGFSDAIAGDDPLACGPSIGEAIHNGFDAAPARLPLYPWFGGAHLLFWNLSDDTNERLLLRDGMPSSTVLTTGMVEPGPSLGFDVFVGRYLHCGNYGLSVGYLHFDPQGEEAIRVAPMVGDHYASMPHWNNLAIDRGSGPESVYGIYDDAAAHRIRRDVSFYGLELNLACFGTMGARRIAPLCGSDLGVGPLLRFKRALCGGGCHGFGGACGPLARCGCGCAQVITTHGFRWFQFKDAFEFASTDLPDGYDDPDDVFFNSRVANDLFGYQFGGRLIYCLGCRLNAQFGGKWGVYANDVSVQQHFASGGGDIAYVTGRPTDVISARDRDVVLAGLGEVDLGFGYRVNQLLTIDTGYRWLAASGVATSVGALSHEYFSFSGLSARGVANDAVMLHGAYVGATLNW